MQVFGPTTKTEDVVRRNWAMSVFTKIALPVQTLLTYRGSDVVSVRGCVEVCLSLW